MFSGVIDCLQYNYKISQILLHLPSMPWLAKIRWSGAPLPQILLTAALDYFLFNVSYIASCCNLLRWDCNKKQALEEHVSKTEEHVNKRKKKECVSHWMINHLLGIRGQVWSIWAFLACETYSYWRIALVCQRW